MKYKHIYLIIAIFFISFTLSNREALSNTWVKNSNNSIQIQNQKRDFLRFDLDKNGSVRVWLILMPKKPMAFKKRRPIYKIDDNPYHDLKLVLNYKTNYEKDEWVRWNIVPHMRSSSDELLEFINGRSLVFQYYLPDGSIEETIFSLINADHQIGKLLKLR